MELFGSCKSDNWSTPQWLYDRLNKVFEFDLDVCADETNHKCDRYYTKEQDGLKQRWKGNVWCNPPYGRDVNKWIEKAWHESIESNCPKVMLIFANTDIKVWHDVIFPYAWCICFIKGRLKFGDQTNSAPKPSVIIVFKEYYSDLNIYAPCNYTCDELKHRIFNELDDLGYWVFL